MSPLASVPVPVEIVIPVYNEQHVLDASVRKLHRYMKREFTFAFRLTIADNASSDGTLPLAQSLAAELGEVQVLRLEQKGRGRALRAAWTQSSAEVVAYMDVDLSTELSALPSLLVPLLQGRADVAIGTRLAPGSEVVRGIKRELISRAYNILLRVSLGIGFSDAQCGFKAARRETLLPLLRRIEDDAWFFDTELLYEAERSKLSIHEVPVRWVDDLDSRVAILATAREDLRGIRRLRRTRRDSARRDDARQHDLRVVPGDDGQPGVAHRAQAIG
jgi:glycosyltransferase involved in cell wall biosynthesis